MTNSGAHFSLFSIFNKDFCKGVGNDRFFHFCPIVDLKEKNLLLILMEDSEMNLRPCVLVC